MTRDHRGERLGTAAGAAYAFQSTHQLAEATDVILRDSFELSRLVEQWAACGSDKVQGRTFEFLEALKFNADAARKRSTLSARTTAQVNPHDRADIRVMRGENRLKDVQAKSYEDKYRALRQLSSERYEGMDLLVPSDKVDHLRGLARRGAERHPEGLYSSDYRDVHDRLTGELRAGEVSSGGTTRREALRAAETPEAVVRQLNGGAILAEIGTAAVRGAAVGGVFGLVFSATGNGLAVQRGEKSFASATIDTAAATTSAAVRAGAVSGGAKAIAIAARRRRALTFAGGAGPASIANGVWETGEVLHRYLIGEIEAPRAVQEVGTVVVRGTATYYGGIVGQMVCPVPVAGALAGAVVGYTARIVINQAALMTLAAMREPGVAQQRRLEIERLCHESIARIDSYQALLVAMAEREDVAFERELLLPLDRVTTAVTIGDVPVVMQGLAELNASLAASLPFRNLADFDKFMLDDGATLRL